MCGRSAFRKLDVSAASSLKPRWPSVALAILRVKNRTWYTRSFGGNDDTSLVSVCIFTGR